MTVLIVYMIFQVLVNYARSSKEAEEVSREVKDITQIVFTIFLLPFFINRLWNLCIPITTWLLFRAQVLRICISLSLIRYDGCNNGCLILLSNDISNLILVS